MTIATAPMLSLIIATRERARTLVSTLSSALNQESANYEVIVSDNASTDDTQAVVAKFTDSRLRYFRTASRLSMCDNYEFGLGQALGNFVIFIGDDDAVMPRAIDRLIPILSNGPPNALYTWPLHIYDWPVEGRAARVAYIGMPRAAPPLQIKEKARSVMRMGGWKYYELPSAYHCAVPRPVLDGIRAQTGRVFHSTQPDVFTAMAIPAFADTSITLDFTVTLNGRSAASNGLGFVAKSAQVNIERFIKEYGDYRFHETLYPGVSGKVNMIPDAILLAKDHFPQLYAGTQFNYEAMWAYACRLGFASPLSVLKNVHAIRKSHTFVTSRFLFYVLVHGAAAARRRTLNLFLPFRKIRAAPPANIFDFVLMLDRAIARTEPK
jgi:glycosyltransferase involved in cell wall biosynthesis